MCGVTTGPAAQLRAQHRLIQHEPYAILQHPMCVRYWLLPAGVNLMYHTWATLSLYHRIWRALPPPFGGTASHGGAVQGYRSLIHWLATLPVMVEFVISTALAGGGHL